MVNKKLIQETEETDWDFGNGILYKMCQSNFRHEQTDKIVGKVLLIGRVYAAAIERRRNKAESNDNFYIEKVAPALMNSELDEYLKQLSTQTELTEKNIPQVLKVHFYLTNLLKTQTEQNKRSFSSKYLHFHLPNLFFIYDTRAVSALRLLKTKLPKKYKEQINANGIDKEYAAFFYKCYEQKKILEKENNRCISNRHFDNILMNVIASE
ncbi:MAG: hypothetical protein WD158_01575 [Balneolaceae bacterium]